MAVEISIVIPAFDEERRLPGTLARLLDGLPRWFGDSYEIVVVDDGSSDRTADIARSASRQGPVSVVVLDRNRGKGAAMRCGVERAVGDVVVLVDADLPVDCSTLRDLAEAASAGDLVLGSRRLTGSSVVPPQPRQRRIGASGFIRVVRSMGFRRASDPQCGVKALRRSTVAPIVAQVESSRFAFDIELIERTHGAGLSIHEVPVIWRHVEGSSVRPFRDAVVTLRDLARLRRELARERRVDQAP